MLTFNLYVESEGILILNASKSAGEWDQSLVGIEVELLNGNTVSDGDNNDLYADDFLVMGVDITGAGVYTIYFWVGASPGGLYGWYDIDIECSAESDTPVSAAISFAKTQGEASTTQPLLSSWFSLQTANGRLVMSTSTVVLAVFWFLTVVLCSVIVAFCVGCSDDGYKRISYVSDTDFTDYVD